MGHIRSEDDILLEIENLAEGSGIGVKSGGSRIESGMLLADLIPDDEEREELLDILEGNYVTDIPRDDSIKTAGDLATLIQRAETEEETPRGQNGAQVV